MNATELLQGIGEFVLPAATVKSVFGEPIHREGKTVVPVARIRFGFGGGSGTSPVQHDGRHTPHGGGGGGGVVAYPAGALEITATTTRFIPFIGLQWLAVAFVAGVLFGRRRRAHVATYDDLKLPRR